MGLIGASPLGPVGKSNLGIVFFIENILNTSRRVSCMCTKIRSTSVILVVQKRFTKFSY